MVGAVGPTGVPQQEPAVAAEGAEMRFYVLRLLQKPFSAGVVLSEASEPHTVIFDFSAPFFKKTCILRKRRTFLQRTDDLRPGKRGSGSC